MSAIQCAECGRFIPYSDMGTNVARFQYVPDSAYSTEVCEWICHRCTLKQPTEEQIL